MARAASATRSTEVDPTADPAKDLDAEIAALRQDVAAITATLGDIAKYRANEAQTRINKVKRDAVHTGEEALEHAQHSLESAEGELKELIREKPISSVLVAAGVGFILSKIL